MVVEGDRAHWYPRLRPRLGYGRNAAESSRMVSRTIPTGPGTIAEPRSPVARPIEE